MKILKILPLTALLLSCGITTAQAAGVDLNKVTNVENSVTFTNPVSAGGEFIPEDALTSGEVPMDTTVAKVNIFAEGGDVVWRWTPGLGAVNGTHNKNITIKGSDEKNTLRIYFSAWPALAAADEDWTKLSISSQKADLILKTFGTQTVKADNYFVSLDVAAWEK